MKSIPHISNARPGSKSLMGAALLAASLFSAAICTAQNYTVPSTTTWSATSPGPTFNGDLIVPSGVTLTIDNSTGAFTRNIYSNITIQPGGTLTISSATLNMDFENGPVDGFGNFPLGSIVVEADVSDGPTGIGGRLYVENNATITGDFNAGLPASPGWMGIFAEGQPTIGQNATNGQVFIYSSTITQATWGVANFNYKKEQAASMEYAYFSKPVNSTGGIIHASGATFLNNMTDVAMFYYRNRVGEVQAIIDDACSFTNCNFDIEASSLPVNFSTIDGGIAEYFPASHLHDIFYTHAYLQDVMGVGFLGCHFQANGSGASSYFAVQAINSGFRVDQYCNLTSAIFGPCVGVLTPSAITASGGATQGGIYVTNAGFNPVAIQNTAFTNNSYVTPITLVGCQGPVVSYNTIVLDGTNIFAGNNVGIGLTQCTAYTVSNNTITGTNTTEGGLVAGMTIDNSGANYNVVNNNTCSNLNYGIQAVGSNSTGNVGNSPTGLTFYCNNLSTNSLLTAIDLSTVLDYNTVSTPTTGIALNQGSTTAAAGNKFASGSAWNIDNLSGNTFNYYYGSGAAEDPILTSGTFLLSGAERMCATATGTRPWALVQPIVGVFQSLIRSGGVPWSGPGSLIESTVTTVDSAIYGQLYLDSVVHFDTLETMLDTLTYNYDYQVQLAALMAQEGRYTDAIALLGNLPATYSLDTKTTTQINNLVTVYGACVSLAKVGNHWDSLSSVIADEVYNIDTTDNGFAQAVTHMLLHRYTGKYYPPTLVPVTEARPAPTLVGNIQQAHLDVYPNPVSDQLYINTYNQAGITLQLTDISGRLLLSTPLQPGVNPVAMQQYNPGIYIAKLYNNGQLLKVQKISKY